jgi:uncharacterized protein DUF2147
MKLKFLIAIVVCLMAGFAYGDPPGVAEPTAAGMWAQVDEHGRVGGWFLIFEENGTYQGAIAKMFLQPGDDPNPICTHCTGDQKNTPSLGLVIIKNMQRKGFVYQKGTILDPRDGQVYQAKLTLSPDGQSLTLRGYIGIELFGQNQVWKRLPNDVLTKDEVPPNLMPYWLALQKTSGGMMTKDGGPPYTGSIKSLQPSQ